MHVRIRGIGSFDGNNCLNCISDIEEIDLLPHWSLVSSVERLASLQAGWLDGYGALFPIESMSQIAQDLAQAFPAGLEYPAVVPTGDGNISFEWIRPESRLELEVNINEQKLELYATNVGGIDFIAELFEMDAWHQALERVTQLLPA
jgi:hypothetical protein